MPVQTVGDALRAAVRLQPDRIALIEGSADHSTRTRISYADLLARSERIARALAGRYAKGTHIAIWAPNSVEWVVVQMAAALAGTPLVMLSPNLRGPEVAFILRNSDSRAIFTVERYRDNAMADIVLGLRDEIEGLEDVFLIDDLATLDGTAALPEIGAEDNALVQYTSGTTGTPKGVLMTHRGIVTIGRDGAIPMGLPEGSVWLLVLPLASVGGSVFAMMGALTSLSTLIVMREFDASLMARIIEEERVNFFNAVTTVHFRLLEHTGTNPESFASVRAITCGGATVPTSLIERIERQYGAACLTTYGMTETSGTVVMSTPDDSFERKSMSAGRTVPGVSVEIRDLETGARLPAGGIGEICVRTPGAMSGYYGMAEATAAVLDQHGWLRTGDLGRLDADGYLSITGRLKEMIKRGGHNVYPREVEDLLVRHPAVAEAAVFGIDNDELGEEIAVAIRLRTGAAADGAALRDWLFPQIAPYKIPRAWHFLDSLPTNANGKVQKFELRKRFDPKTAVPA